VALFRASGGRSGAAGASPSPSLARRKSLSINTISVSIFGDFEGESL
jgi:hypothetical protein